MSLLRSALFTLPLFLIALSSGCSGSDDASTTEASSSPLAGSIDGKAFEPVDVIFVEGTRLNDATNTDEKVVRILASNKAGLCDRIKEGTINVGDGERVFNLTLRESEREKLLGAHEPTASVIRGEKGCQAEDTDFVSKGKASISIAKLDATLEGSVASSAVDGVSLKGRFIAKKCAAVTNGTAVCSP